MQEVKKDGILYAIHFSLDNMPNGFNWHGTKDDTMQLATRKYKGEIGKKLRNHWHEKIVREVNKTQECMILIEGKMKARVYDKNNILLKEMDMRPGDCVIFYTGGHGYTVCSDRFMAYEVKAGKYVDDMKEILP